MKKVFRDPIYGYIHVEDELIIDLINTKEFQRLRRIKQLGGTSYVFNNAEHSRFSHSLGVYHNINRVLDSVDISSLDLSVDDKLALKVAALLHDIGHGPFSHSFEKIFDYKHEEFSEKIILSKDSNINKILMEKKGEEFVSTVASYISKTSSDKRLENLISGPIDVDRADYLVRDSYFTGVTYGNIDIERLWRVIDFSKDSVVIKESGIHVIEQFMLGRYHMFWQVYLHPVGISVDILMQKILHRAKDLYETGYEFKSYPKDIICFFENNITVKDYLKLDETQIIYMFIQWQDEEDEILGDLSTRYLERNLFKGLTYSKDVEQLVVKYLKENNLDIKYYMSRDKNIRSIYDDSQGRVDVILENGDIVDLSEVSSIVKGVVDNQKMNNFKQTDMIFVPKEIYSKIKKEINGKPKYVQMKMLDK